jgi:hypothetical protein
MNVQTLLRWLLTLISVVTLASGFGMMLLKSEGSPS